jgi:hypothetical protein
MIQQSVATEHFIKQVKTTEFFLYRNMNINWIGHQYRFLFKGPIERHTQRINNKTLFHSTDIWARTMPMEDCIGMRLPTYFQVISFLL